MKKTTASRIRVTLWAAAILATLGFLVSYIPDDAPVEVKVQSVRDGIVMIRGARNSGSGIVIAPNTVLTARHVVEESMGGAIVVEIDGQSRFVSDIVVNTDTDAAILTVAVACPCWNETVIPKRDEKTITVGYPFGLLFKLQVASTGEFQGFRVFRELNLGIATADVEPGSSGGAVFVVRNGKPYLIGIAIIKAGAGLVLFVPITELKAPGRFKVVE